MCCRTNQCCCGCMPLKKGIVLAASIDIIFHILLGLVNFTFLQNHYLFGEYILVVADIMLICGTNGNNGTVMVFWLIICMITIVVLFIGWIVIPVLIFFVGMCKTANSDSNFWYEKTRITLLPQQELFVPMKFRLECGLHSVLSSFYQFTICIFG